MRMSPLLRLTLAAAGFLQLAVCANSMIEGQDHERPTSNNMNNQLGNDQMAQLEAGLMRMLGLTKRPRPLKRDRAHVPEALVQLQRRQKIAGVTDIAKRGIHIGSANTARAFVHVGE